MANPLSKLLAVKSTLIVGAVAFAIGSAMGGWMIYKYYSLGEVKRLKDHIEHQEAAHARNFANLKSHYTQKIQVAVDATKIEKVIEYVKDDRACDINADTEQLLDVSRTGVSIATAGVDATVPRPAAVTARQQIATCARDGIQYRELKLTYDGLRQFINDNWIK